MRFDAEVLIVGAGPVGLMLACELALGGVRALVIERRGGPASDPRAGAIGALAGEALERRGLGPALDAEEAAVAEVMRATRRSLEASGGPVAQGAPRVGGNFAGLFLLDQSLQREPGRRLRGVPQQALERILAGHAGALGVEVWRGQSVEAFQDTGEGVRVEVRGPDGARSIEVGFLVGCDGGRSTVRKQGGFDFPGTDPTLTGHKALVEIDHPERLLPIGWRRTATGMVSYGPLPGLLNIVEFDGPPEDRDAPVTVDEIEQSLRRVSGAEVRITALLSATRWTDHARQASSYRRGRVLLAGDAAHVQSPFGGGQGLNLGLLDAVNLGWKLAATVRGRVPDGLLDTYQAERHPVAAGVLDNTRAQLALMRPDPQSTALRQIVADLLTGFPDVNRHFGEMISGVTTRYDLGDDDPLVGRLLADRDLPIDGATTRLFSLMHDGRGLLIDGDGEASEQGAAWASQLRVVQSPGARSMLVRRDGCIAWAGRPGGLRPALERWFQPATQRR
jgi:2-polyprenyl-6-methoxyphenol hydroxylase-like FAD-dependent oxidoreductase